MLMCSPFYYHSERVPGDGEDDSDDYVDVDEDDVIDNLDDDYESGSDGGNYWSTFILIILSHKVTAVMFRNINKTIYLAHL